MSSKPDVVFTSEDKSYLLFESGGLYIKSDMVFKMISYLVEHGQMHPDFRHQQLSDREKEALSNFNAQTKRFYFDESRRLRREGV